MTSNLGGHTTGHREQSVAVIGAGIIGITTALALLDRGFQVTLLDGNGVAAGASAGNAAHIATEQVFPLAHAGMLWQVPKFLADPLGPLAIRPRALWRERRFFWHYLASMGNARWQHNQQQLQQLCQLALPAWQRLLARWQLTHLLMAHGNLLTFEGPKAQQHALEQQAYYAKGQVISELWTASQLQQRCAGLSTQVQAALFFPNTAHTVCPRLLCEQLVEVFEQQGGRFLARHVDAIVPNQPRPAVRCGADTLHFDALVLCTGVHANQLLNPHGMSVPLTAERGYHLQIPSAHTPPFAIASFDRKMIVTPFDGSVRVAGTVEFAGIDAAPNWQRAYRLRVHGEALWPALAASTSQQVWSGQRPTVADSLPVIGASAYPHLWCNFGHQHLGLTLAACSSELVCDALDGKPLSPLHAALALDRFS